MAHPRQSMCSRLYRFCNDYPIVVFPLAVDLYRIVICSDYRRPTFTEFVLYILAQCVCWSTLLLTMAPIVHLAVQFLERLHELTVTMKHLRKKYRNLKPSIRDALHRWHSGLDVAGWKIVRPFDWYSYAMPKGIEPFIFCDAQSHPQLTETVFYARPCPTTRNWYFYQQSLADGSLKLLRVCPYSNDGRKRGFQPFCANGTLLIVLWRDSLVTDGFYGDFDVICYHLQSKQLWRARLPVTKEILIRMRRTGYIFSVSCDALGLLTSMHWSCNVADRMGQPFRNSIRTDYYVPIEFQRMSDYYQVTMASRRTAEEIYVPDNPGSKTYSFYISNSLHGLRTKYIDRRDEEFLLCNPYDAENRYKLVKAVARKEVGRLCGPRQYRDVSEIFALPFDVAHSSTVIRTSEKEILIHIGGCNVIRTTFGQVQQTRVQKGGMSFRLSGTFNEPPPATVQEHLVAEDD